MMLHIDPLVKVFRNLLQHWDYFSSRQLTSEDHTHSRGGSTKDVYYYTIQLCTPEDNFNAVYQIDRTQINKHTLLGMSNASFAFGGGNYDFIINFSKLFLYVHLCCFCIHS